MFWDVLDAIFLTALTKSVEKYFGCAPNSCPNKGQMLKPLANPTSDGCELLLLHPPKSQDRHLKSDPWLNTRKTAREGGMAANIANPSLFWVAPTPQQPIFRSVWGPRVRKVSHLQRTHYFRRKNQNTILSYVFFSLATLPVTCCGPISLYVYLPSRSWASYFPSLGSASSLPSSERARAYLRISDSLYQLSSQSLCSPCMKYALDRV